MKISKKTFVCIIAAFIVVLTMTAMAIGCTDTTEGKIVTYFNNETDHLIFSTLELDKVFNPFYSTSATDSNVVSMTQISMLGNDKDGNPTYGDSEAVVTKDLEIVTVGEKDVNQTTTYYFVLKNNVKFSNGSLLSMKDVLFNLYVYLDPAYTGSSTIYSTDIVGLKEYRTQESSETEQDSFNLKFQTIAETRIDALLAAADEIFDEHKDEDGFDDKAFQSCLEEYVDISDVYANVVSDYKRTVILFRQELESDYSNSLNTYEDTIFTDKQNNTYRNLFTTDVESFLYNEGYIIWNKAEARLESSLESDPTLLKTWTKEKAIDTIVEDKLPFAIDEVLMYWNTAFTLNDYIVNDAMEKFFKGSARKYMNISGIQFANRESAVTVNGIEYATPTYDENGNVTEGNEVLSITINDIDPKAIWNFAFNVAPMYYYSDAEHIEAFDYEQNFGVEYMSQTFMTEVIKDPDKIGVPVGAGPYAASKSSGGIENIKSGDFYSLGIIYYERNPYFVLGPAKINKIRYKVVSSTQMLSSLYTSEIHFAEPNAKPETKNELDKKASDGIGNKSVQTTGYGYIGINAGKVPDIEVRQAIMHSINTLECVSYYKTTADPIYRSMSLSSWAYPKGCQPYYPYIGSAIPEDLTVVSPYYAEYVTKTLKKNSGDTLTEAEQLQFLTDLVRSAGYEINGDGVYQNGSNVLEYTFTIAGEEPDHPAWNAMFHAREILNKVGFQITVKTDAWALKKLATGDLTVWAAAWVSTIDPDMYQVYHKDSKATSVLNWGYKQILLNVGSKYDEELALLETLSDLIDDARKTNDDSQRAAIYSRALDIVMQLAIELPTYQRDDLFAFDTNRIDVSSLTPDEDLTSFKGLTSDIYSVSLNEER